MKSKFGGKFVVNFVVNFGGKNRRKFRIICCSVRRFVRTSIFYICVFGGKFRRNFRKISVENSNYLLLCTTIRANLNFLHMFFWRTIFGGISAVKLGIFSDFRRTMLSQQLVYAINNNLKFEM